MPRIVTTREDAFCVFEHAVRAAGGTMTERFPDERIRAAVEARFEKD